MRLIKIEGGRINVYEPQNLTADITVSAGQALKLSGGKLALCGATDKPVFVALASFTPSSTELSREIAVGRVESNQVYEVAYPGAVTVGTKYTLTTDAKGITTTTTSGVAEVVYVGTDVAHVRFS